MVHMERDATVTVEDTQAQAVRMWAVEQMLGALVRGNNASVADIAKSADKLATYVLTGEVPS